MPRNMRQEALSRACIQAIAAHAGMGVSIPSPDTGIDLALNDVIVHHGQRIESGWRLDIQAKSTTLATVDGAAIRYDLDVAGYETLRYDQAGCPRLLILLVLPTEEANWVEATEQGLTIRHASYYLSLSGRPPSTNRRTVRLSIPRQNLLTPGSLRALMERVKRGEVL